MKHSKIRLYLNEPLAAGASVSIVAEQHHYLNKVMRCRQGDIVNLFNAIDGEYVAILTAQPRVLLVQEQMRLPQAKLPKLGLAFVPIKNHGAAFIVQKATELGVSDIYPLLSRYAVVNKVNLEKLQLVAIEAAEQCGRLAVPQIHPLLTLPQFVANLPVNGKLLFADESGAGQPLPNIESQDDCLLIGPEGGFSKEERQMLNANSKVQAIHLGKNILRAETAAVAALAVYQATVGEWYK